MRPVMLLVELGAGKRHHHAERAEAIHQPRAGAQQGALVEAAGTVVQWEGPYRTFKALSGQCLACNAGPHLTDLGLTDGTTRQVHRPFLRSVAA